MSSSETENTDRDENKPSKAMKLNIKNIQEVKEMQTENLYEYIDDLHALVKKQDKKLKKYKNKINKLTKEIDRLKGSRKDDHFSPDAQRENTAASEDKSKGLPVVINKDNESKEDESDSARDAFSFVDEMRQAAQQAQNISNFIYEPTSGLYYDQKSGYYYNAEYGLYYDGNTGCYYSYNQEKNCYEFHSQVQVQPTASAKKGDDHIDEDDVDEVVFDEFGVVTDREKLKRLREEKEQQKQEKDRKYKKKSSKSKDKDRERKHKKSSHKKRKRSKKHTNTSSGDDSGSEDTDREKRKSRVDFEDGELSTSSSSSSSDSKSDSEDEKRKVPIFKSSGRFQDIAKKYPPSLRIVVQETNLDDLKVGNLSLITYKGGSLGREGNHDVIIPDVNVSKFHLKFTYDTKQSTYKCVDLGSRNGTILNGTRMSASKTESESYDLVHGSVIQIAQTKLLCHIHEGNSTCGLCEPGLLIEPQQRDVSSGSTVVLSHKEQLKKIQKKYGLENEKFVDSKQNSTGGNAGAGSSAGCSTKNSKNSYQDRAASRRLKVGSSTDKEKTQTASVDTAISSDNKGFRMLSKLGWNKGEALGKTQESGGLLEPINVESNSGHKGLGCDDPTAGLTLTVADKKKLENMKKTKERYEKADIFSNIYDSS
ncbi:angiogenic factor with G patch and FHA domains 1 isoform X2 [Lucilia sericata]|uniref:angiogenic factor with G patch and FHA domains 1 isoform X2 n=1 Tax=Lucilia sericata TaxID=13632 RepID=UPI0018A8606A|nr:angiogenic factor with G patch and FHA domains 1 isoform X2 [Lucilia sericata]